MPGSHSKIPVKTMRKAINSMDKKKKREKPKRKPYKRSKQSNYGY